MITLTALNAMTAAEFVTALSGVFEHSDWVAERAAADRPFDSVPQLLEALQRVVARSAEAERLALIRAHPALRASSVHAAAALTASSASEQRRAGLTGCTPAEAARLAELNSAYQRRFGFPFILAVRGHDPGSIIARCEARLTRERADEFATALHEIDQIASFRLGDRVG
jgi:2-oxo-4-hydroxy-4-carboxy-5-ureidoimidazoline decarboxylase